MEKSLNKKILIVILAVFVLAVLTYGAIIYQANQPKPYLEKSLVPEDDFQKQDEVLYIINYGEENINQYQIDVSENSTVFSLLEELAEKENFEIETVSYPEMGILVSNIGEALGGTDGKWWQYWVNGNLSEVAADKKEIKKGDIVEWKFEIPKF